MNKIKITKEQLKELTNCFNAIQKKLDFEGDNTPYSCMNRIKRNIEDRKNITIKDLFEMTK